MMEFVEEKPKFGDHHSIRRRWVNREHAYTITENLLADNKTVYKAYVGSGHTINLLFNHDVLKKRRSKHNPEFRPTTSYATFDLALGRCGSHLGKLFLRELNR